VITEQRVVCPRDRQRRSRRTVGARHQIKPYPPPDAPAGKINVTDPDSRNLKTTRGCVQGYNAQAVVATGQIVIAAEISTESLDTANLQPMIQTACREPRPPGSASGPRSRSPMPATGRTTRSTRSSPRHPDARRTDADRKSRAPGRRGGLYDLIRRVLRLTQARSSI
jgi:hypothetical protein